MPANPIFVARALRKTYGSGATEVVALRDVSLEIAAGEFVGCVQVQVGRLVDLVGVVERAAVLDDLGHLCA